MSRTYRRKATDPTDKKWSVSEHVRIEGTWSYIWVPYPKNSNEYKKGSAKYHSDAGTHNCKEPGPSWFRNLYTERPQRQEARQQLKKFMNDPDFEVILNAKDPLEYWT